MKKLGKLKFNDAKIMNIHEMKAITGGQVGNNYCRNTGTSTGAYGDTEDIVCSGECPTVGYASGTSVKQTCQKDTFTSGGNSVTICMCK